MTSRTLKGLEHLADGLSTLERHVSPMQIAAQLLERSVEQLAEDST